MRANLGAIKTKKWLRVKRSLMGGPTTRFIGISGRNYLGIQVLLGRQVMPKAGLSTTMESGDCVEAICLGDHVREIALSRSVYLRPMRGRVVERPDPCNRFETSFRRL